MTIMELQINAVGARGDGIANSDNGPIYVPFALDGEHIKVNVEKSRGEIIDIIKRNPDRIAPICQYFGVCGGCTTQHMSIHAYKTWKLGILNAALAKEGLEANVSEMTVCQPGERRRVALTAKNTPDGIVLGYHKASTNDIIDIAACPVASPDIEMHLETIRDLAKSVAQKSKPVQLSILLCDNGLDISASAEFQFNDAIRQTIIQKTVASKIIKRFSFNDDVLIETEPPKLTLGGVLITPPPGSFVQASKRAEQEMIELVTKHLKSCKKVADLFSGCGTFSFPLAKKSAVHAVEAEEEALVALDRTFRNQHGLKPIFTERRDLFRRPLMRDELKKYQGVVFDPPRAGAELQAKQIARSVVKKVAAVSCNPTTLARDLKILSVAGFRVKSITAVDQFLWSPHIEAVALLER